MWTPCAVRQRTWADWLGAARAWFLQGPDVLYNVDSGTKMSLQKSISSSPIKYGNMLKGIGRVKIFEDPTPPELGPGAPVRRDGQGAMSASRRVRTATTQMTCPLTLPLGHRYLHHQAPQRGAELCIRGQAPPQQPGVTHLALWPLARQQHGPQPGQHVDAGQGRQGVGGPGADHLQERGSQAHVHAESVQGERQGEVTNESPGWKNGFTL